MASNTYVAKIVSAFDKLQTNRKNDTTVTTTTTTVTNNEYEQAKSKIQADSLATIEHNEEDQNAADLSVDFHDSLDESVSDNENLQSDDDDARSDISGSSTSTESLIERSRKYLTDEAGIIILKTKKVPKTSENFNIILNFDIDGTNKQAQRLKIESAAAAAAAAAVTEGESVKSIIHSIENNQQSGGIGVNVTVENKNKNDFNLDSNKQQQSDTKSTIHDLTQRYFLLIVKINLSQTPFLFFFFFFFQKNFNLFFFFFFGNFERSLC